jgi:fatty acid desaturase
MLFLCAVAAHTALIAYTTVNAPILAVLLSLPQALLLVGCQEAKHLSVHRRFLSNPYFNDTVGMACAALFGINFVCNRYFHYQHHRATCTDADPEGHLYRLSWSTRWIWLLAPVEVPWVAFHINRIGWTFVPAAQRRLRHAAFGTIAAFAAAVAAAALCAPATVVCAYLLPLALASWIDFLLTQAEHYGAPIAHRTPGRPRNVGALTLDIVLPLGLGWLTLHRSLHRVHHLEPGLPWYFASRRMRADATASPVRYATFARRWLTQGPRRWVPRPHGEAAAASTASIASHRDADI